MDKRAKVCLIIGGILLLVGIGGFALGISQVDDIEEGVPVFALEDVTNGTLMVNDEDGQGAFGFTFYVEGSFVDANDDGTWDHCEQTSVTVTDKPDIVRSEWSSDGHYLEGDFYNEVIEFDGCDSNPDNKEFYHENTSFIKLGRACYACGTGAFTFESNQSVYVVSDDDWDIGVEVGIAIIGFLGGVGSLCCGIIFLIVGTILVFTLKDEDVQPMMMNQDGQFVIQQSTSSTSQVTQSMPSDTVVEPYSFPSTGGTELETKEE